MTFYAVSTGPGSAELMTVQAVRILERCAVIMYPCTAGRPASNAADAPAGTSRALDTVRQLVDCSAKTLVPVQFGMRRDDDDAYRQAAEQSIVYLKDGKDVAFVCLGDVSLYSTASRIGQLIRQEGYAVLYAPGVSSPCAAACTCGMSLASESGSVRIISGAEQYESGALEQLLGTLRGAPDASDADSTLVIMKSGRHLADIIGLLARYGLLASSTMVKNCSHPGQQVWSGEELSDLPAEVLEGSYLSLLLVRFIA